MDWLSRLAQPLLCLKLLTANIKPTILTLFTTQLTYIIYLSLKCKKRAIILFFWFFLVWDEELLCSLLSANDTQRGILEKYLNFEIYIKKSKKKKNNNYNGKIVRHYIFTIALVLQYSQFASRIGTEKLRIHKYFIWLWSVWIWSVSLSVFGEFIIEVCSSVR